MPSLSFENGLFALAFARRNTLAFAEDVPEDQWCHQVTPGANHAYWILGHLAWTDDYFLSALAQRPTQCPPGWADRFANGSKPTAHRSEYPPPATVKDLLIRHREALVTWFKSLSERELASALPKELAGFAPNHCAALSSMAWHEGLHAGQLTVIRRSLGFPPKFM